MPTSHELLTDREYIYCALCRHTNEVRRFVNKGKPTIRKAPGDYIGVSYAFNIYDFANGTYGYTCRHPWRDRWRRIKYYLGIA